MKRIYVVVLATVFFSTSSFAQKGNNLIGVGADMSFPTGDFGTFFKTGIGGYAKVMYGIAKAGQITFTTGYTNFVAKGSEPGWRMTNSAAPFVAGYRHNFNQVFVEPQVGYGLYGYKITEEDWFEKDSQGMFTWAIGAGYRFTNHIEISGRYQSGTKDAISIEMFGLRVGYNFSLSGKK